MIADAEHAGLRYVCLNPPNLTLLPLPARSPELNPVENLWRLLRGNWLSNRIFASNDDILDHCCDAWNRR